MPRLSSLLLLVATAAVAAAPAARAEWTPPRAWEIAPLVVGEATITFDFLQSLDIARRPRNFREAGVAAIFIGNHPSARAYSAYFGACLVLNAGLWLALPSATARALLETGVVGFEAPTILGNHSLGMRIRF